MMTIKVEADKVITGLINMQRNVNPDLEDALDKVASATSVKMSSEAPKGKSLNLSSNVQIRSSTLKREIEPIAKNLSGDKFAMYIEKGSGPAAGHAQYTPNVFNIQRYYGVDLNIAWAIAKTIKERGNEADPFVQRTFDYMRNNLSRFAKGLAGRIIMRFMQA